MKHLFRSIRNMYTIAETGTRVSTNYRLYFGKNENAISPFHDIPLHPDSSPASANVCNMIVEIPKWSNAKMEICKEEPLNPIKQDVKKGALRYVDNLFPCKGYMWNYGALPQTWEDPAEQNGDSNTQGDNDPLDVCEISQSIKSRGSVVAVKILGVLGMIDEGETDWKIIAIDAQDEMAEHLNDIDDVEKQMPGMLKWTRDWFRMYKVPQGKPENEFLFDGQYRNKEYALNVISDTHTAWKRLISGQHSGGDISKKNVTVEESGENKISNEEANAIVKKSLPLKPAETPIDPKTEKSSFVMKFN